MTQKQFGLIGLGVMGQNLALNIERNGIRVVSYDHFHTAREKMTSLAVGKQIEVAANIGDFIDALARPRHILLMVPAGEPVDIAIQELKPWMQPGDLIIDGGNSYFMDTERRAQALSAEGFHFMGLGVSGGAEGALWGPSLMAGGDAASYEAVAPVLLKMAARAHDGKPCVAFMGPGGAGHYVKMVHNGIEYGDMQLIAEAYDLLHHGAGVDYATLHEIFAKWNKGVLASYLIEITADIFTHVDEETQRPLLDLILDRAGQKGTGKWTSQNTLDVGAAIPTLTAAVNGRLLSSLKEERLIAAEMFTGPSTVYQGDTTALIEAVHAALYASKICAYAQGMALLRAASKEYNYDLDLAEIARIWRAGCIIRADFLDDIARIFEQDPDLPNLLLDAEISQAIAQRQEAWRLVVGTAVQLGISMSGTMASLGYFDSYRNGRLPANLIQAQRDYFGAHTFERVDRLGHFHHNWSRT
ncbi:MAG: NADP-dependent phosphogluconate dehydrogenase [Anaerolineae bacterium]|nr:NADP-dependent phosphogluconate dehydrogenase [Anaerolineae bacterium]